MARLIDGEKFRSELNRLDCIDKFGYVIVPITKLNIALERSTVDAVFVVRCRECKHRDPEDHKCDCGQIERQGCPFPVGDYYFCASGERKGGDG